MWICPKCGKEFKNTNQSHYCGEKPKTIEEYILYQDKEKQADLLLMRQTLQQALPEAEERISWSMPTYWKNHNILHFAASKKHIGFYPGSEAVEEFKEELDKYSVDKGTIHSFCIKTLQYQDAVSSAFFITLQIPYCLYSS